MATGKNLTQLTNLTKVINEQKKILNLVKKITNQVEFLENSNKNLEDKVNKLEEENKSQKVEISQLQERLAKQGTLLLQSIEKDIKPLNNIMHERIYGSFPASEIVEEKTKNESQNKEEKMDTKETKIEPKGEVDVEVEGKSPKNNQEKENKNTLSDIQNIRRRFTFM